MVPNLDGSMRAGLMLASEVRNVAAIGLRSATFCLADARRER
jgi:hypothetical protein